MTKCDKGKYLSKQSLSRGRWILGVTGASGIPYALRLLELMLDLCEEVHVVVSDAALRVIHEEHYLSHVAEQKISRSRLTVENLIGRSDKTKKVTFHSPKDIGASVASGSYPCDGMVIVPCSMATLAAVSNGLASNLIHRAADVVLKENRKLILVPRETPLSLIHLENLTKVARAGATILPAMPGFYHQPAEIQDLVDMLVMKILDQMGYDYDLVERWGKDYTEKKERENMLKLSMS